MKVSKRATGNTADVRTPKQTLAELDSLTGILCELDQSLSSVCCEDEVVDLPEHPEVSLVSNPIAVETDPCLVCGQTQAVATYEIQGIHERLVCCQTCGLGSLFPLPSARRVASFYPTEYYGTPNAKFEPLVEWVVRTGARRRVKSLVGDLQKGSRVLDVGCGRGVMVRALIDSGYEAHGVEISEAAAAAVDPRAEVRIAADLGDADYDSNSFDAVVLWHVLEHLRRPDQTLDEIRRILKPGGRVILAVPNFDSWQAEWSENNWFHLDLPRHLYHFSPSTLNAMLEKSGFATESTKHFALLQNPFGWLQSTLNRTSSSPRNSLYSLLHRRGEHEDVQQMSRLQQSSMKLGYYLGLPIAGLVSILEAMAGRGGTIATIAHLPSLAAEPVKATNQSVFEFSESRLAFT